MLDEYQIIGQVNQSNAMLWRYVNVMLLAGNIEWQVVKPSVCGLQLVINGACADQVAELSNSPQALQEVKRLTPIVEERREKLKEEMMGEHIEMAIITAAPKVMGSVAGVALQWSW